MSLTIVGDGGTSTGKWHESLNFAATNHYRWGEPVPVLVRATVGDGLRAGLLNFQKLEAFFVYTSGLKVVAPATPNGAKGLLKAAIRDDNPVIYFENKYLHRREKGEVPREECTIPIGSRCEAPRRGLHSNHLYGIRCYARDDDYRTAREDEFGGIHCTVNHRGVP